jgi:predicted glycogen debranching enzyme
LIKISTAVLHDPDIALSREWLVTNGVGGYASSTIIGANSRRYHGLLIASFPPPLERQVLLSKVDEEVVVGETTYLLGCNEFHDGTIHPQGYKFLTSFQLLLGIPTWKYELGDLILIKQIWMEYGQDTVYVRYKLLPNEKQAYSDSDFDTKTAVPPVYLRLRPFCAFRGYHHDGWHAYQEEFVSVPQQNRVIIESSHAPYSLQISPTPEGDFEQHEDWYHMFLYRAERERGFNWLEDLYTPGFFTIHLQPGKSAGFTATCERQLYENDLDTAFAREMARRKELVRGEKNSFRKNLLIAADQFVVSELVGCKNRNGSKGILAGYHWFTDWGRDTMISLPGLLLSTKRFDTARDILLRYIQWVDGGMIPNRFTDEGLIEYNTADATLWYFQAVSAYAQASGDREIISLLFPRLADIIEWHIRGTRYGIHVDPSDGLLFAGREGSQVTWMDACVENCPVTPRIGKPVEINALWYNALCHMSKWAEKLKKDNPYKEAAKKCKIGFKKFWYPKGYLYDVIDGPCGNDNSLRPNQIIAVSLPYSPISYAKQKAVVDTVERMLLTPYGLRSLSPDNPAYVGTYSGGPRERDSVYHQGTAWPWLLGQFADAHYRVYKDKERIHRLLRPFRKHLIEAGVGSISEIFDGDPPYKPRGCIAQAWSVAEILRICTNLASSG